MKNTKLAKASILETECTDRGSKKTHTEVEIVHTGPPGPRTMRGKGKVRYNAMKHGIFSEAILIRGESRAKYQELVSGLMEYFQAEGAMEEILVGKLCANLWRQRRLYRAECAEIVGASESVEEDALQKQLFELEERKRNSMGGMLYRCRNPLVIGHAVNLLKQWRELFEERGFDSEFDLRILERIYGAPSLGENPEDLMRTYMFYETSFYTKGGEEPPQFSPRQAEAKMRDCIDWEINRLEGLMRMIEETENRKNRWRTKSAVVPPQHVMDRLLRYDASLDRSFDRTLNQLERLQRIRLGQSVPAAVKIDLSH